MLPIFWKGLEKIIASRITVFAERMRLISGCQHAFWKHLSTEIAFLEQKEFILNNLEDIFLALGVSINYSKTFDSIRNVLLLKDFTYYDIRGIALYLITSYLKHGKQLMPPDAILHVRPVQVRVPQGSISSPLLFDLYVNYLVKYWS